LQLLRRDDDSLRVLLVAVPDRLRWGLPEQVLRRRCRPVGEVLLQPLQPRPLLSERDPLGAVVPYLLPGAPEVVRVHPVTRLHWQQVLRMGVEPVLLGYITVDRVAQHLDLTVDLPLAGPHVRRDAAPRVVIGRQGRRQLVQPAPHRRARLRRAATRGRQRTVPQLLLLRSGLRLPRGVAQLPDPGQVRDEEQTRRLALLPGAVLV